MIKAEENAFYIVFAKKGHAHEKSPASSPPQFEITIPSFFTCKRKHQKLILLVYPRPNPVTTHK
jgi:hypothetical protein